MNVFTQIVFAIGRLSPQGVQPLGTGFLVDKKGLVATTRHVVGHSSAGLCVILAKIRDINSYQDTSDRSFNVIPSTVKEVDPIRDLAILQTHLNFDGQLPRFGSFSRVDIGSPLGIFGYPHVTDGRMVLTYQQTILGAKVFLESQGLKVKYGIINNQARPGQSGSLIIDIKTESIVGVLIGAYSPTAGGSIEISGVNPQELHQTTHCVSAEYITDML